MSFFTAKDVIEKTIFSDEILSEKEWDSVLFILDTKGFVDNIKKSILNFSPMLKKVNYANLSVSQYGLDEFTKSLKYQHQKELRFSLQYDENVVGNVKKIDNSTLEVAFDKVQSVIIPTKEFREGFYLEQ